MPEKTTLNKIRRRTGSRDVPVFSMIVPLILGFVCLACAVPQGQTDSANSILNSKTENDSEATNVESRQESPAAPQPSPSNPEPSSSGIPPELLRQIQSFPDEPQAIKISIPVLKPIGRLLLLLLALIVTFASIITCRYIHTRNYFDGQNSVFLLLGFFGAIVALLIAAACVGSLYLHLAAAVCTITSGFCLMAFLLPQFELTRRWVTGTPKQTDRNNSGEPT
jgi:hypothetical protein